MNPQNSLWDARRSFPDSAVSPYPPSADTPPTTAELWKGVQELKFDQAGANPGNQAFLVAFNNGAFSSTPPSSLLITGVFQDREVDLLRGGGKGGGPAVPETSASSAVLLGAVGILLLMRFFRR